MAEWQVVTGPRTVVRRVGARTMRFFDDGPIPSDHNPVVATVEIG